MFKIFDQVFLSSFLSSLSSGLIITAILAIITYVFTDIFKKPNLTMIVKQDGSYSDVIKFTKEENGDYRAKFQLAIKNSGNTTFKAGEGFWHTYIKTDSDFTPLSALGESGHQRELIEYSIYPNYIIDITNASYNLVIKKGDKPLDGILYFFATNKYGYFPKKLKFNLNDGTVAHETFSILKFQIPD